MAWRCEAGVVVLGLAFACGPEGVAAGTETETDTESGTAADTESANTGPSSASASASATASASASGDGTTSGSDPTTGAPDPDSSGDPPPGTDGCTPGLEGCLCDVGAMCEGDLVCDEEGFCVDPDSICSPLDEDPHDDESTAYDVDAVGCSGTIDLGLIGTLEGPQTDWYTFLGNESFACPEEPSVEVVADEDLEVCVYIECVQGNAVDIDCGGADAADSPDGRPGCCDTNQVDMDDYDCSGMFSGLDIVAWVSVGSRERICADYTLSYSL
ncbi:MAG: hypothetical protein K0V04_02750 [Deltaproteobacteria bacterium]|nr:hypothetical protein [Deltaproteobacteria bacterium]